MLRCLEVNKHTLTVIRAVCLGCSLEELLYCLQFNDNGFETFDARAFWHPYTCCISLRSSRGFLNTGYWIALLSWLLRNIAHSAFFNVGEVHR